MKSGRESLWGERSSRWRGPRVGMSSAYWLWGSVWPCALILAEIKKKVGTRLFMTIKSC